MEKIIRVGDKVEILDPIYFIQEAQSEIKPPSPCTLQTRQFGIVSKINGGYYYVTAVIKGKRKKGWGYFECYENELRLTKVNIFNNKIYKFKKSHGKQKR